MAAIMNCLLLDLQDVQEAHHEENCNNNMMQEFPNFREKFNCKNDYVEADNDFLISKKLIDEKFITNYYMQGDKKR